MLAFMPRSPLPSLGSHHMSSLTLDTGSRRPLTLLQTSTPMSFNQQGLQATFSPSPAKKPKLSLNTSNISPIFGKGATSLRLETLSATSPTARNTFANRYEGVSPETPSTKPVLTPIATNLNDTTLSDPTSPSQISLPDSEDDATNSSRSRTASVTSITSISTIDSEPSEPPYKLPFNANSILSNGPIPRIPNRKYSFSQSRPMFPMAKKVGFRAPLTEEVRNIKYTMRHSDIETFAPSISIVSENNDVESSKAGDKESALSSPTGVKRESDDVEEDSSSSSNAATPVSGRAKRHRWVWTLAPVQSAPVDVATSSDSSLADPMAIGS